MPTTPADRSSPFDDSRRAQFVALRDTGDERIRAELIEVHLPLAAHLARRFTNRGVPTDDLMQVASMGLVHAVDRFDPTRNTTFATFATPTILGEIRRHFRDRSWDLRVPRRMQELHLELNGVIARLTQELGRAPSIAELAGATRASDEEVVEAIEAGRAYQASSLDSPVIGSTQRAIERALRSDDDELVDADLRMSIRDAFEHLPPREQLIMHLRFWDHRSQVDIAHRLGISQMHVSRLLARSLDHMSQFLGEHAPVDQPNP